jgi:hypothetical protein
MERDNADADHCHVKRVTITIPLHARAALERGTVDIPVIDEAGALR